MTEPEDSANRYWEGRWRDERAEIERLRAALKPFAECIDEHTLYQGNPDAAEVEVGNWANLRYNDFVRARNALRDEQDVNNGTK